MDTHICGICGCTLNWKAGKKIPLPEGPTLDRINNEEIMTLENVQIICHACNRAKGKTPMDEYMKERGEQSDLSRY
jgi:5-methylcytosine-specific restriction endonuclease McrA